jgi:type II secretory pathway component HofQ
MEFHDADLKTVLLALAEEAGVSIVLPGDLRGTVTCILDDVSWLDALHAVAETAGYVVVHEWPRRP